MGRSVCTVGCFTDRPRTGRGGAFPGSAGQGGGGFPLVRGFVAGGPRGRGPGSHGSYRCLPPPRRRRHQPSSGLARSRCPPPMRGPAADLGCTFRVPRSYLARSGGRHTRSQSGRFLPGPAWACRTRSAANARHRARLPNIRRSRPRPVSRAGRADCSAMRAARFRLLMRKASTSAMGPLRSRQ